jgi:RNAse (barnase) inhibitor barstar
MAFSYDYQSFVKNENAHLATIPVGLTTRIELFDALYKILNFPDYFGFNWDALDECLTDLHWLPEGRITLVHEDLPILARSDLKIYLEILRHAVLRLKQENEPDVVAFFEEKDRQRIQDILA